MLAILSACGCGLAKAVTRPRVAASWRVALR